MSEPRITTYLALSKRDVPPLDVGVEGLEMTPVRCPKCGRFLCYQAIVVGAVRVKCRGCKIWVTLDIIPPDDIIENEVEEVNRAEGEPQGDLDRLLINHSESR